MVCCQKSYQTISSIIKLIKTISFVLLIVYKVNADLSRVPGYVRTFNGQYLCVSCYLWSVLFSVRVLSGGDGRNCSRNENTSRIITFVV